ncbi:uncharacterized protein LOC144139045 isoform X2 [Haemaphysalis longicornis]
MRPFATRVTCAVIIGFLALGSTTAQCESEGTGNCTTGKFPDLLGLQKCLPKSWDICNVKETELDTRIDKLADCLTESEPFERLKILSMHGLRDTVISASRIVLSKSGHALLAALVGGGRKSRPQRLDSSLQPEGCSSNHTINITVPENLRIEGCAELADTFCSLWGRHDISVLSAVLLSSLVVNRTAP